MDWGALKTAAAGWASGHEKLVALRARCEQAMQQFHKGLLARDAALAEVRAVQAHFVQLSRTLEGVTDEAYQLQARLERAVARLQTERDASNAILARTPEVTKKSVEDLRRSVQRLARRAELEPAGDALFRQEVKNQLIRVQNYLRAGGGKRRMKLIRLAAELRVLLGEDLPPDYAAYEAFLECEKRRRVSRMLRDSAWHPVMPRFRRPRPPAGWVFGFSDASLRDTPLGAATGLGGCLYGTTGLLLRFSAWRKGRLSSDAAEQAALLHLLEAAAELGVRRLRVHVDNQFAAGCDLSAHRARFEALEVIWLPRKRNQLADYLARLAVSRGLLPSPQAVPDAATETPLVAEGREGQAPG